MSEALFELKTVSYAYQGRYPALVDLSLRVERGRRIALMGANGCGKSTLLGLLDGLIFPASGRLLYKGAPLDEARFQDEAFARDFRRSVGLVFQDPDVQLFCPTVRDDIVFGPLQLGLGQATALERLDRLASGLEITHLLDRAPHQLSLGEKHRVALASTLAVDPDILLLDEPTAGLDPRTTAQLLDILLREADKGRTIITSTHDLHIVEAIADEVLVFGPDKRLAAQGTPASILADTALLRANNLLHEHRHRHQDATHAHAHAHAHGHGHGEHHGH